MTVVYECINFEFSSPLIFALMFSFLVKYVKILAEEQTHMFIGIQMFQGY